MGKHGKRQGRGPRGGGRRRGRGPAGGAGAGAGAGAGGGGGGGRPGAGPAPPAGGWADPPRDLLEAVARAVPADRLWFRLVCRRWAAAGAEVPPAAGEEHLPPGKGTRTNVADAVASVARANDVLYVLGKNSDRRARSSKPDSALTLQPAGTSRSCSARGSRGSPGTRGCA